MGECFLCGQKGEIDFPPKSLSEESWDRINEISQSGKASEYWQVGDEKDIIVNGETLTLVILDFNHDDLESGGKAGITFGMKNLMAETRQMNSTDTNVNGFTGSNIYTWLQGTLFSYLPSDLQNVIKNVNKKTSAGNKSDVINTNAMKMFLFSEIEVTGQSSLSFAGEGTQYSYFSTTTNRTKKLSNGSGAAEAWWERSPTNTGAKQFCKILSSGFNMADGASWKYGVCFGFCV